MIIFEGLRRRNSLLRGRRRRQSRLRNETSMDGKSLLRGFVDCWRRLLFGGRADVEDRGNWLVAGCRDVGREGGLRGSFGRRRKREIGRVSKDDRVVEF